MLRFVPNFKFNMYKITIFDRVLRSSRVFGKLPSVFSFFFLLLLFGNTSSVIFSRAKRGFLFFLLIVSFFIFILKGFGFFVRLGNFGKSIRMRNVTFFDLRNISVSVCMRVWQHVGFSSWICVIYSCVYLQFVAFLSLLFFI